MIIINLINKIYYLMFDLSKYEQLKQIRDDVILCKKCDLYKTRNLPMIWKGSHDAKIMFIWEAPGKKEDETWHPFMGSAGKILDEMLDVIWISRNDIYITNILKCHPPKNRNPMNSEIEACTGYLKRQIKIINPKIICTLWRFSTNYVLSLFGLSSEWKSLTSLHWKVFSYNSKKIIPLFHPAAALYDNSKKTDILMDAKKIIELL
jgi:DNA polymerase